MFAQWGEVDNKITEKTIERFIVNTPKFEIFDAGLQRCGKIISQKKIGLYGISDVIGYHRDGHNKVFYIDIYEIKLGVIGLKAYYQALRYLVGIKKYIEETRWGLKKMSLMDSDYRIVYTIILVGSKLENSIEFKTLCSSDHGFIAVQFFIKKDSIRFKENHGNYLNI